MRDLINSFHVLRDVIKIDRNDMSGDIFADKKKLTALSFSNLGKYILLILIVNCLW